MHVGQHGKASHLTDFGEDRQGLGKSNAPLGADRGAVGLVERGLIDQGDPQTLGDLFQGVRRLQGVLAAL